MFESALLTIANTIAGGATWVVNRFKEILLGLARPGSLSRPETLVVLPGNPAWYTLPGGNWRGIAQFYCVASGVSLLLVVRKFFDSARYSPQRRKTVQQRCALAFVGNVVGWVLLAVLFHATHEISMLLVPDAREFFATPGNAAKLGFLVSVAAVLIAIKGIFATIGVVFLLALYAATLFVFAFWPFAMYALACESAYLNIIASTEFGTIVGIIGLRLFQTVALLLLFGLNTDPIANGPAAFANLLVETIGMLVVFVGAPLAAYKRLSPRMVSIIGNKLPSSADEARENLESNYHRLGDMRERFNNSGRRSSTDEDRSTAPRSNAVGQVSNLRATRTDGRGRGGTGRRGTIGSVSDTTGSASSKNASTSTPTSTATATPTGGKRGRRRRADGGAGGVDAEQAEREVERDKRRFDRSIRYSSDRINVEQKRPKR